VIQYELGNYRSLRGEYPEAKQAFERALELSPRQRNIRKHSDTS